MGSTKYEERSQDIFPGEHEQLRPREEVRVKERVQVQVGRETIDIKGKRSQEGCRDSTKTEARKDIYEGTGNFVSTQEGRDSAFGREGKIIIKAGRQSKITIS